MDSLVGLALIAPFATALLAGMLKSVGFSAPFEWIGSSSVAIVVALVSLLIGIPVAFALNLWRIARCGLRRRPDELEGVFAIELAPLHLGVVFSALLIGGLFVAHLAADSFACLNGVPSVC